MFHGRVMSRHLKEQKLALFTSLGRRDAGHVTVFIFLRVPRPAPDLTLDPTMDVTWMYLSQTRTIFSL